MSGRAFNIHVTIHETHLEKVITPIYKKPQFNFEITCF
jgi:hypothetical protein